MNLRFILHVCLSSDTGAPSLATNITLLKASEVDAIFEGNDDMFKTVSINSDSSYQM